MSPPRFVIHKADNSSKGFETEDVEIVITENIPKYDDHQWAEHADTAYWGDAHTIARELIKALPQGTLDRLTVLLMERQCTLLRINYPEQQ